MIAMFDSGLGGLSVWREVVNRLPQWSVTYVADQAYCPYGSRTEEEIIARSLRIGRHLEAEGARILAVACNTATSAAAGALRAALKIPVVGVEPAIKPAAAASRRGRIGVLATPATLASDRFQSLLSRFAQDVEVVARPGEGWVEQVESGDLCSTEAHARVQAAVRPIVEQGVDHIVLGCTHYPFLAPLVAATAGPNVSLHDPAAAVARQVAHLLEQAQPSLCPVRYRFLTTSEDTAPMARGLAALVGERYAVERLLL